MDTMKQKIAALCCVLVLTGAAQSHASIAVIDTSNIAQQAKTYAETMKVVQNTREQIQLYTKDLAQLPRQILDSYKKGLLDGWDRITAIMQKNGGVLRGTPGIAGGPGIPIDPTGYMQKNIPGIIGNDLPGTIDSYRSARLIILGTVMRNNTETLTAIQQNMEELENTRDALQDAMQASADATGSVQAQQAANQIAALQVKMQSLQANIEALKIQQGAIKNQADAQDKQNQYALEDARAKAEEAYAEKLKTKTYPEPIRDPWIAKSSWWANTTLW